MSQSYPPTGLSVLVVGGGLGGLMFALEAKRKGHTVTVLERYSGFTSIGDAFGLGPSALTTLHHYPRLAKAFEALPSSKTLALFTNGGQAIGVPVAPEWHRGVKFQSKAKVYVPWTERRSDFLRILIDEVERQEIPIIWDKSVVEYSEDKANDRASVRTQDGSHYSADVVVAADGIGSRSHAAVTGKQVKAVGSGYACYRFFIPTDAVLANENVRANIGWKKGDEGQFRLYFGPDIHMNLILSDENTYILLTHASTSSSSETWNATATPEDVVKTAETTTGWAPWLLDLIRTTPPNTPIVDWSLAWRDPQPTWTSPTGRIVQLGDAAHAFFPTSGNGAVQALEDAISLAEALRLGGRDAAPDAARAHAALRFARVSMIQRTGVVNRAIWHATDFEAVAKDPMPFLSTLVMGGWIWGHDPEAYTRERFDDALRAVRDGVPLVHGNLPPGGTYEPWDITSEMEREKRGEAVNMRANGDWSL